MSYIPKPSFINEEELKKGFFRQYEKMQADIVKSINQAQTIPYINGRPIVSKFTGYEHAGARDFDISVVSQLDPCLRDSFKSKATPGDSLLDDLQIGPFHSGT
jgi:hypothetical protein